MGLFSKQYDVDSNGVVRLGISEGFPVKRYKDLTPDNIKEIWEKIQADKFKCAHCNVTMIVAAFGPNKKDGGDYVRDPFFKAKHQHYPGFECQREHRNVKQVQINSVRDQKSLENALNSLIKISGMTQEEIEAQKVKPSSKSKRNFIDGDSSSSTERIQNVTMLPQNISKVKEHRKYKFSGYVMIRVQENNDPTKPDSLFINRLCKGDLALKLSTATKAYDLLKPFNGQLIKIAAAFYIGEIEDQFNSKIKRVWIPSNDELKIKLIK